MRIASDEEAAQTYVTQMPGKMFADYAVPSIHAWAVVLQISEVVRPGVFRSIRQLARAACEPPCSLYARVQVSFGFTIISLLIAKSGNNVMTVAQGDDDFHKVRDGLQEWLEDEVNAESSEEGGNYFIATVLVAWFKPFSPDALMLDK